MRWKFKGVISLDWNGSPSVACVKEVCGFSPASALVHTTNWLAFCFQMARAGTSSALQPQRWEGGQGFSVASLYQALRLSWSRAWWFGEVLNPAWSAEAMFHSLSSPVCQTSVRGQIKLGCNPGPQAVQMRAGRKRALNSGTVWKSRILLNVLSTAIPRFSLLPEILSH